MLILDRADLARGEVRVAGEISPEHLEWKRAEVALLEPVRAELVARGAGDSVWVHGTLHTRARFSCSRCLSDVVRQVETPVDLLFAPQAPEDEEADGEVYPLAPRAKEIDLADAVREQLLLNLPAYVICSADCKGLCPQCGADLNAGGCSCEPERDPSPWDALKNIKFD
jgi:uncharacterized protein